MNAWHCFLKDGDEDGGIEPFVCFQRSSLFSFYKK